MHFYQHILLNKLLNNSFRHQQSKHFKQSHLRKNSLCVNQMMTGILQQHNESCDYTSKQSEYRSCWRHGPTVSTSGLCTHVPWWSRSEVCSVGGWVTQVLVVVDLEVLAVFLDKCTFKLGLEANYVSSTRLTPTV